MFIPRGIAETFLFKDDFYQYEEEIRFIAKQQDKANKEHMMISCDLKDVIEEVVIDPRASDKFLGNVRQECSRLGLTTRRANEWHHFPMVYKFTKK